MNYWWVWEILGIVYITLLPDQISKCSVVNAFTTTCNLETRAFLVGLLICYKVEGDQEISLVVFLRSEESFVSSVLNLDLMLSLFKSLLLGINWIIYPLLFSIETIGDTSPTLVRKPKFPRGICMHSTARRKDLPTLEGLMFPTTEERRKHVLDVKPLIPTTHFLSWVNFWAASTREQYFWITKATEILSR